MQYRVKFPLCLAEMGKLLIDSLAGLGQRVDRRVQFHLGGIRNVIAYPQAVRQQVAQRLVDSAACVSIAGRRQLRSHIHGRVCLVQPRAAFAYVAFELVGAFH